MSTTPQSTTPVLSRAIHGHVDPEVEHVINLLANGLKDAHDAIINLKGQHDALKATVASVGTTASQAQTTANQAASAQQAPVPAGQQRAITTADAVQQKDHLGLVQIAPGAAAATLTLNNLVTPPYTTTVANQSGSAWTLAPSAGTVNGGASYSLAAGATTQVFFDGRNWIAA